MLVCKGFASNPLKEQLSLSKMSKSSIDYLHSTALQQRDLVVCTTSSVSTSVPVTSTQLRTTLPEVIVTNSVQQGENIFDRRQWWHLEELKPAMTNVRALSLIVKEVIQQFC